MKKLLIIGASGFLGKQLMEDASNEYEVIGTYNSTLKDGLLHLDITNESEVKDFLEKIKPDITILSSALTDLKLCETNPDLCKVLNIEGVKNVAKYVNGFIVFLSTDYVLDGEKGDYKETDKTNPINEYGKSKLEGEKIISRLKKYLIIRSSSLYTSEEDNPKFINMMIAKLRKNENVKAVNDIIASPTLIDDLSKAILTLIKKEKTGLYHVVGDTQISLYNAVLTIADVFKFNKSLISSCSINDFPPTLRRPKNTSLNISKLKSEGIKMHSLREGLEIIKNKQS